LVADAALTTMYKVCPSFDTAGALFIATFAIVASPDTVAADTHAPLPSMRRAT